MPYGEKYRSMSSLVEVFRRIISFTEDRLVTVQTAVLNTPYLLYIPSIPLKRKATEKSVLGLETNAQLNRQGHHSSTALNTLYSSQTLISATSLKPGIHDLRKTVSCHKLLLQHLY